MGGPHGGGGAGKGNQTYDSNGPDIRVRGNAHQVLEKYLQMARDAGVVGDRVAAENYLQHAEHYYRMIAAQTEGQRPRIGGRELSVADVNVQNVSQGLSAALYAAPVSADGLPANGEQAGAPSSNGNYGDDEGDQFAGFNGQGRRESGNRDAGNRDHGNREGGNREQIAVDGRGDGRNDARNNESRNNEARGEGRGPRRYQRGQGRDGQRYDGQRFAGPQGFQADGNADGAAADGAAPVRIAEARAPQEGTQSAESYNRPPESNRAPESRTVDRSADEQPDYPTELLAQPMIAEPAVRLPDAQPALPLAPAVEASAEGESAEAAPVRRGRGRPRGSTSPRRTRSAAAPEGEAPAEGSE